MKIPKIIIVLAILILAVIVMYSVSTEPDKSGYIENLMKERVEKDSFMKNSDASPLGESRTKFTGLHYFDVDPSYEIIATLHPVENKKVVTLTTSSGEQNQYLEYAWAEFNLNKEPCRLLILEVMASGPTRGTLFLAFADDTSTKETYGAGRYLEVKKVPGASSITLDFNKAYNPYCAYVDNFSCPLPPKENILKVPIRAGEKSYH